MHPGLSLQLSQAVYYTIDSYTPLRYSTISSAPRVCTSVLFHLGVTYAAANVMQVDLCLVESEYNHIIFDLADPKLSLLRQSHATFLEMNRTEDPRQARQAAALKGESCLRI